MSLSDEVSGEAEEEAGAVCCLTRLIGNPEKAKDRVKKLRILMNKIDGENSDSETDIFKAVADPCRLRILKLLRDGELVPVR